MCVYVGHVYTAAIASNVAATVMPTAAQLVACVVTTIAIVVVVIGSLIPTVATPSSELIYPGSIRCHFRICCNRIHVLSMLGVAIAIATVTIVTIVVTVVVLEHDTHVAGFDRRSSPRVCVHIRCHRCRSRHH